MLLNSGALICNMFGWITYSVNLGSENEISDGQGKGAITLRQVRKRGYYCQTGKEKGQLLSDGYGKGAITVRQARKIGNYSQTGKEKGQLLSRRARKKENYYFV